MAVYPTARNPQDLCYFVSIEKDDIRRHAAEDRMRSNNFAVVHLPKLQVRKVQNGMGMVGKGRMDKGEWVKGKESALWIRGPLRCRACGPAPAARLLLCLHSFFRHVVAGMRETVGDRACIAHVLFARADLVPPICRSIRAETLGQVDER